uniref:Uncharacterized protein n=1 Tax=Romanomermis culicivorax TaxID=13658 RepID=A0A915I1R2_ROMCU
MQTMGVETISGYEILISTPSNKCQNEDATKSVADAISSQAGIANKSQKFPRIISCKMTRIAKNNLKKREKLVIRKITSRTAVLSSSYFKFQLDVEPSTSKMHTG